MLRFRHAGEADRRGDAEEWPRLRKPFMLAAKKNRTFPLIDHLPSLLSKIAGSSFHQTEA
jgi:hypothetical protein